MVKEQSRKYHYGSKLSSKERSSAIRRPEVNVSYETLSVGAAGIFYCVAEGRFLGAYWLEILNLDYRITGHLSC